MARQPEGLIDVLLDSGEALGDRQDAAMDLSDYDEPAAEQALLQIALDASSDEDLADEAGHSLWEIWQRKGKRDADAVARMHPAARKFFD
jgi:hypothetical protein